MRGATRTHGGAAASVGASKQRVLRFAAQRFVASFAQPPPCRFDVVAIDGEAHRVAEGGVRCGDEREPLIYHPPPCSNSASSSSSSTAADLKYHAAEILTKPIADAVAAIVGCITAGGKVLACGNGGSASDAQHFAAEFIGRFERERPGLAAIALTTDTSILTAISNDYDYSQVFAKQLQALGQPGDVLLRISRPAATRRTCSLRWLSRKRRT